MKSAARSVLLPVGIFTLVMWTLGGGWRGVTRAEAKETPTPLGISIMPEVTFPEDPIVMGLGLGVPWGWFCTVSGIEAGVVGNFAGLVLFGFQVTPGLNTAKYSVASWQIAGVGNSTENVCIGIQTAIGFNRCKKLRGLQLAVVNQTDSMERGMQLGVYNRNTYGTTGGQIGIVNRADSAKGLQFGIFNQASEMHGVQVGVVNRAETVEGVQIGLVNVATTHEWGWVPLARVSF